MEFKRTYYSHELLKLNCAHIHGRKILAKPVLLLSIITAIEEKVVTKNKFVWSKEDDSFNRLEEIYKDLYLGYIPNEYQTPLFKPFFHLKHEGFWHLDVKDKDNIPKTSSICFLRNELNYAYLDPSLWDLLQYPEVREEYKQLIIDFFLKPKND